MSLEIERKFLVRGDFRPYVTESVHIVQGYLSTDRSRTVRVRTRGSQGFLTIKGPTDGISRFEWETEIPLSDAQKMLEMCTGVVDKTRNLVPAGDGLVFEVDEFHGRNEGLVMAEIELSHPEQGFPRPEWLGEEVSHDPRYYNSQLLLHPYDEWPCK